MREGRKEDLKKKYSDKYDEETLDWILNISDLVDFNHKYTDFVLRVINPKNMDVAWWVETIIDELKLFDKYQNQLEKKILISIKLLPNYKKKLLHYNKKKKKKN